MSAEVLGAGCGVPGAVRGAACKVLGAACVVLTLSAVAAAQMPDPRMMHGQAIPAGDMPAGDVTVRVVRQAVGNNVAGVVVELHGAGPVRTATTAQDGRAQFAGLPPGARVHAVAMVDGERLESLPFDVPASGGVRTILVAGLDLGAAGTAAAATPARPFTGGAGLTFGNNTRFAIEFQDDTMTVFYLLEIVNTTGAPAALPSPLQIDLPRDAVGTALLDGAPQGASVSGPRVTLAGPIPVGLTSLPVAYRIETWAARHELVQSFPLPIDQLAIGVQRLEGLTVESPQAPSVRDASLSGQAFLIATGGALPAGTRLRLTLGGLPHKNPWPLYFALGLAAVTALAGVWLAAASPARSDTRRAAQLDARRARGLGRLRVLDADYAAGRMSEAAYRDQRTRLLADLERIYGELDASGRLAGAGQERVA